MGLPREPSEHSDASDEVRSHSRMEEKKDFTSEEEQGEDPERVAVGAKQGGLAGSSGWDPPSDKAGGEVLDENDNNVDDDARQVERLELGVLDEGEKKDLDSTTKADTANSKNVKNGNGFNEVTPHSFADSMDTGEERQLGEEGEEDEEEEEEDLEMTLEERKAMREAVVNGDIDLLEDLLEKPNADIRMVYFEENLLMAALRGGQLEMAEFLLDNGVDHNFTAVFVEPGSVQSNGKGKKAMEFYEYSCRQMAYDKEFADIVEIIDQLNGHLFPGVRLRERVPRLRRPPPTPVSSSSCGDSTSSGEESDVSGETGPDERFKKPRRRAADGGEVGDAVAQSSGDNADGEDEHERKKKKKRKKKKEEEKHGDGGVQDGDRKHHRRRSSEVFFSVPGGDTEREEPSAKIRSRKSSGRHLSTEYGSEGGFQGSVASSSRRCVGEGRGGETGDHHRGELLTDRSRSTTKSSEARTTDTSTVVNDEGYETMSPSPTHSPPHPQPRFQPPSIPVKPTKSFLALRRTLEIHRQRCIPARYNEARPLHWTKVRTPGSYEVESPFWHQLHPSPSPSPSSLSLSTKLPPPTPAGTATTPSMLSPRSRIEPRTPSQANDPTRSVSTVELTCGGSAVGGEVITKPMILTPTQRLSASSRPKSSGVVSLNGSDTKSAASSTPTTAASTATTPNGPAAKSSSATNDNMYPLKHRVPNYMRMTTSCFVKRRLEPNFTNSYSALDFVEPSPRFPAAATVTAESYGSGAVKASGGEVTLVVPTSGVGTTIKSPVSSESAAAVKKTSHFSRVSDEGVSSAGNQNLVARKPTNFLLSVASPARVGGGFPVVADSSSSTSPLISRRKPLASAWVGGQSSGCGRDVVVIRRQPRGSVPNIRNNSSVFQHPAKLTTMPRKGR